MDDTLQPEGHLWDIYVCLKIEPCEVNTSCQGKGAQQCWELLYSRAV